MADEKARESQHSMTITPRGVDIAIRDFLSSIAPGMFLLLLIYFHHPHVLDTNNTGIYRPLLLLLVMVPAGFVTNGLSYFLLAPLVRYIEGWLMQFNGLCGKWVTMMDWDRVLTYFGLDAIPKPMNRSRLLFRYDCEQYLKRYRPEIYRHYSPIIGMEILSRNLALLAAIAGFWSFFADVERHLFGVWPDFFIGLAGAVVFLLFSAFDSLYVGLHSVGAIYLIARYELSRESASDRDLVLGELYRKAFKKVDSDK